MYNQRNKSPQKGDESITLRIPENMRKKAVLGIGIISMILLVSLFFIPFYSLSVDVSYPSIGVVNSTVTDFKPIHILTAEGGTVINLIVFAILFILTAIGFVHFLKSVRRYSSEDSVFAESVQKLVSFNAFSTGFYYLAGIAFCFVKNSATNRSGTYSASSYLPFVFSLLLSVTLAFIARQYYVEKDLQENAKTKLARIEFFVYGLLVSALTIASSLSDILQVTFVDPSYIDPINLNGQKIFNTYNSLGAGFQMVAFVLFAILTITISLAVASLVSLISKSDFFYKITLWEIIGGSVFSLLIGLFGKYYEIVQKLNEEGVLSWLNKIVYIGDITVKYKIKSDSYLYFLAVMAIVALILLRKPYTRGQLLENPNIAMPRRFKSIGTISASAVGGAGAPIAANADPCPAFTELDSKTEQYALELAEIKETALEEPTLQGLVQFIVNYARDSRLHLSYKEEDIAAFIAGLGATRLTILQGMSGTGKTSLPKIFTEAIFGNCDIIEIESSWRDKNELLGYYNEFSRIYTPKKFTQALYKAKLNPEKITFIVLDEMNLSRIEYYFSDFLSLMENEEDKREIKLLNVGLYHAEEDELYPYLALTDGHTIKIPSNVWFIGTANRDESTFEISDKVYDRAHTMNFNKRAPKVLSYNAPIPQRYLSAEEFIALLEEAKQSMKFDISTSTLVREVEDLLAPYNISFGNRIANQMEAFIAIYCACFTPSEAVKHDALEKILLSKVVSKLEFKSIENKEHLAAEFKKRNLHRCGEFILKLNED